MLPMDRIAVVGYRGDDRVRVGRIEEIDTASVLIYKDNGDYRRYNRRFVGQLLPANQLTPNQLLNVK